ncbi:MAG: YecA family protein [Persicimonas sp.]
MRRRCAELKELACQAGWDQVDVGRLAEAMDGLEAADAQAVVAALVEEARFEQAGAVVIAAKMAGCPVPASVLDPLAYSMERPGWVMLLARAVADDPVETLVRVWKSGRMSNQTEALVAYLLGQLCESPPPQAVSSLRLLCRIRLNPGATVAVGEAVRAFDDPELSKVGARHLEAARVLPNTGWLERQVTRPIFELLPERAARNKVIGRTVQRSGEEVGRNDPCPCDSGRKYKKCCLRKAREKGRAGAEVQPSLTDRQFLALMPHELVALDYEQFDEPRLVMTFEKFVNYSYFDRAADLLEHMERRGVEEIEEHRAFLIERALFSGELDVVRRQVDHMDEEALRQVELDLLLGEEEVTVAALEERVLALLGRAEDSDEPDEVDLAMALLRQRPALGIFVARGAMSAERPLDAEMLAQLVEEVRDTLMLPPGDRAAEIRDMWAEQRMETEFRHLAERISTEREREAAAEADELRKKYSKVRRERQQLQSQLAQLQRGLANFEQPAEHKQPEQSQSSQLSQIEVDRLDVDRLRQKIERLKAIIDDKNTERSQLREQVSELHDKLEDATDDDPTAEDAGAATAFEALESVDTRASGGDCLLPRFDDAFCDAVAHLPAHVVRRAVSSAAELATSSTAGWTDVKRLQTVDVFTRRLGRDWRMFFRLAPDRQRLDVLEVVSRQDFERALVRYRG